VQGACTFTATASRTRIRVAIASRAGVPANQVAETVQVWILVAHALAQLLHTIVLATAPRAY